MNNSFSEYDVRQYRRMLEQIEGYQAKCMGLDHLVSGLKALGAALEQADVSWQLQFGKYWGVLEMAHANIVNKDLLELSPEEQRLVDEAVRKLKAMVESQIPHDPGNEAIELS